MGTLREFRTALRQPVVEGGKIREPGRRREQPFPHIAHLVFHLALFPTGFRGAGHRLEQIMMGQRHEPPVATAFLAHEDGFDDGF